MFLTYPVTWPLAKISQRADFSTHGPEISLPTSNFQHPLNETLNSLNSLMFSPISNFGLSTSEIKKPPTQ